MKERVMSGTFHYAPVRLQDVNNNLGWQSLENGKNRAKRIKEEKGMPGAE